MTLIEALDLDKLERRAAAAVIATYDLQPRDREAAFWIQKGIEGMRLAVAEAIKP